MNVRTCIVAVALLLVATACPSPSTGAPDPTSASAPRVAVQLESLYNESPVRVTEDAPPARSVSLSLSGGSEARMSGTLILDPNVCSLNAFGDPQGCTKIAVRGIEVDVQRVRIADPANLMRRSFVVTGEGLPQGLAMIVQGQLAEGELERCYLKLGSELVPLYIEDGA